MNNVYEMEYRYSDEEEFHNAYILIYHTGTTLGKTIQQQLDLMNETGNPVGLDKLLYDRYKLDDAQICFYFDRNDIGDAELREEIERSYDIYINDMWIERDSNYGKH